ncbi:MAG: acetyl-CoA carboxylase carboxyl transferase subunit beta [Fibrella sp.]|nr:acetyl-CoA carboxylase carboxyl transferase subunit beta [Armatimonadota bacterium]
MPWFSRKPNDKDKNAVSAAVSDHEKQRVADSQTVIPVGAFVKCTKCSAILYTRDFERDLKVCSKCGHHHPLTADERIAYTVDEGSFKEYDRDLRMTDPLDFPEYKAKAEKGESVTGRADTMVRGTATIGGFPVSLLVADFRFMGGSMGSVFGEKFVRAADYAIKNRVACVVFVASGGARMQEGLFGLMQMAKTSASVAQLAQTGTPYIVVLTHPTTGGAWASFAALGDVIFAEPEAYVAFAGARVASQAKQFKEPTNYQTAEFQQDWGKVDRVVPRKEMTNTLTRSLTFFGARGEFQSAESNAGTVSRNGVGGH